MHPWSLLEASGEGQVSPSGDIAPPHAPAFRSFQPPQPSGVEESVKGLLAQRPEPTWFVISGSYLSKDVAIGEATKINREHRDFDADVYLPYGDNKYYAVVIGAGLSRADALELRRKAIAAGLSKATYLWAMPTS
jgi:hypothetical protein